MEMKKLETTEEILYEQAVSSLRQLNQEVFLNDLDTNLKQTVLMIQQEVDDLKAKLEDDQLLLSSTIQDLKQVVHTNSVQSMQRVEKLDSHVRLYFQDFYGHFTTEIEQMNGVIKTSVTSTEKLIDEHVNRYEEQLQNVKGNLMDMVQNVEARFIQMEFLYERSCVVLDDTKADMGLQARVFQSANEEQRRLFEEGKVELTQRMLDVEKMVRAIESRQEESREQMKQDVLAAIADVNLAREGLDQSRLTWEQTQQDEAKARVESEALLRQHLLTEVTVAQEAAVAQLKEENAALASQMGARDRQNRFWLIGLGLLGAVQIGIQFI